MLGVTAGSYSGSIYNLTPDRLGVRLYIEPEYGPPVTDPTKLGVGEHHRYQLMHVNKAIAMKCLR